jgi:hypothetical protein
VTNFKVYGSVISLNLSRKSSAISLYILFSGWMNIEAKDLCIMIEVTGENGKTIEPE